jgi:hypothetical protein
VKSKDNRILHLPPGVREANEAMINYVSDRSVAIIVSQPSGQVAIGSGTAVKINSSCLIATAAHLFDDISSESHIRIVPRGIHDHPGIASIDHSQDTSSPNVDVAWIQLEQSSATQSGLRFLDLDDLLCGQRHDSHAPFMVQGFPADEAIALDKTGKRPFSLGLLTSSVKSDPQIDALFLEYPPQSTADLGLELVHPNGLSGGGIWIYPRYCDSLVWSSERSKLVAITRSWDRSTFRLRTEPIERWLQRVARDLPKLRDTIGAFMPAGPDPGA